MIRECHFSASAPVRLDFAGGWTDVPPFSTREGGAVIAAAISPRAQVHVVLGGHEVQLVSEDLGETLTLPPDAPPVIDGRLDLLKAALRLYPVGACALTTRSDVPAGSGLGSSGALDVALVAALSCARGLALSPRAIADEACRLERDEARIAGGRQDQLVSALGGFQYMVFCDPDATTDMIALDTAFADELQRSSVLCYTGTSRVSGRTIARVASAYDRGDRAVVAALHGLRDVAYDMREALAASDLARVAVLLSRNWIHQQALDPGMRTDGMARLEHAAGAAGALGGKAAGAGAGGCMFFVGPGRAAQIAEAATASGATVLDFTWSSEGVRMC